MPRQPAAIQYRVSLIVDQDTLAFLADHGVDGDDYSAALRAELHARIPEARISVRTSLAGSLRVDAFDQATGKETWTPRVREIEDAIPEIEREVGERLIEAAPAADD